MTVSHISALALTFLIYGVLAIAYLGWGRASVALLAKGVPTGCSTTSLIWIGWAMTLLLFQFVHFFLPLTAYVVVPVLIAGASFGVCYVVKARPSVVRLPSTLSTTILVILGIVFVSWVASRSMLSPWSNYDSGLYHFNKIRWINCYPVVPGLGNLHGRLAFNQSFFHYVAALNFYPFFGQGRSVANSFLLLLTFGTVIDGLRPVFGQPSVLLEAHPFRYLFLVFLFPPLVYFTLYSKGLFAPVPDLTASLVQLAIIAILVPAIGEWNTGLTDQHGRVIVLGLLATTAVTVKLSSAVFAAGVFGFLLLYARIAHANLLVRRIIAVCLVMLLVWCTQGFLLSGAPLYPSTFGYFPVEWAVPLQQVVDEAKFILSWARQADTHWDNVLGNWNWFIPWLLRLYIINWVVLPVAGSVTFCGVALLIGWRHVRCRLRASEWLTLLPSTAGIIYWFFTAPELRFAQALLFTNLMCAAVLLVAALRKLLSRSRLIGAVCAVFFVSNLPIFTYFVTESVPLTSIAVSGWQPVTDSPLDVKVTASGLPVYVPRTGDQPWDSPLPATPYFNPYLRLLNPTHLSSGFTIKDDHGATVTRLNAGPRLQE